MTLYWEFWLCLERGLENADLPIFTNLPGSIQLNPAGNQAEKEGTVEPLVPWTVVGRPVDGRRKAGGRSSPARRACRQRRRKKCHLIEAAKRLIEAAPFGGLDQM